MESRKRRRGSSLAALETAHSLLAFRWRSFAAAVLWWWGVADGQPLSSVCLLCNDGSAPIQSNDPLPPAFGSGASCNRLLFEARDERRGTPGCESVQLAAFQAGCCGGIDASEGECFTTLCPGGGDPSFPRRAVAVTPGDSGLVGSGALGAILCRDLAFRPEIREVFLGEFVGTPGDCGDTWLARSSANCGCPGVDAPICSLCGGQPVRQEEILPLAGGSCGDAVARTALLRPDECGAPESFAELFGFDPTPFCCSSSSSGNEPPSCAVLCDDPFQALVPERVIETERYGSVRCSELARVAAVGITTENECAALRRETNGACCREDLPPGGNSGEDNGNNPGGNSGEDNNNDGGGGSGSEDDSGNEDETLPLACRVCPLGETPVYPERVLFSFDGQTCNGLAESLQAFADRPGDCQRILDEARALQNCPCWLPPSPTDPPNASPGGGSVPSGASRPFRGALVTAASLVVLAVGWREP